MLFENLKLAFSSMLSNKLRTLLSLLGMMIGVAAVVTILTLGDSASGSITQSIASGGLNTITLYPTSGEATTKEFTDTFGVTLQREVAGLEAVLPINTASAVIRNGHESGSYTVMGVPSTYASLNNYSVGEGAFFTDLDNMNRQQVIVLGSDVADDLFPDGNAIGETVSILYQSKTRSYTVVGVMDAKDAGSTASYDTSVFIPYNTFVQRLRNPRVVTQYLINVADGYDTLEVSDQITAYLDSIVGSDGYQLFSPATLAQMSEEITGTFSSFLAAIAAISLLVGGIGIMNIMLVSVAERTREIGIRKALGASPRVIRGQFLTEAVALTLLGGLFGIVLGTILSVVITHVVGWSLSFSPAGYLVSLGFSMAIGIFFGWYPAMKAAKLNPIDALNWE
ncbi:MAG: ABC transporter permease [Sphaerochaeta sp.]|jgi:putative ABC transport system permease protein|nr:ABC transporter permease [Sphaerochaeta sp.]MCI2104177.1 ABC transporter permease [Sphaerochaeta sp.]